MEIKKPENYQPNGQENLNNELGKNLLQFIFIISMMTWLVTSVIISIIDIFNGFQNALLTLSFISSIVVGSYLKIRQVRLMRKTGTTKPKKDGCSKCGKKKLDK